MLAFADLVVDMYCTLFRVLMWDRLVYGRSEAELFATVWWEMADSWDISYGF